MKSIKFNLIVLFSCISFWSNSQTIYQMDAVNGSTITTCQGQLWDSQNCFGASEYCNNENYTVTISSGNPAQIVALNFLFVNIEFNYDFLIFYDGPSTASPVIGNITGFGATGITTAATAASVQSTGQFLTVQFVSDGSVTYEDIGYLGGFQALIGCEVPDCSPSTPAAGDVCSSPTVICDLNGYCGTTSGFYTAGAESAVLGSNYGGPFCGSIENNSWIEFTAGATTASFTLTSSGCDDPNSGIQAQIYNTPNCNSFTAVSGCINQTTSPGTSTLTATGLTVGNTYYIMVDGYAGNACDYTITANTGVQVVNITSSGGSMICNGASTTLTANATGATNYAWSASPGGAFGGNTSSVTVSPTVNTTYTCVVSGVCGGGQTLNFAVTIDNVNPTITCPGTVNTTTDAGSCTATGVSLGTPTTADNCAVASVTNNAPAAFPIGSTTVTWTVTDNNGNTATCNQTVNVTDNENPTISCPGTVNVNANAGSCFATGVSLGTPTTNDNCSVATVTNNAPASFPVGSTTVTWTVTDGSGNTNTCTQTVNVTDNQNPTITCPGTVNVNANAGSCFATGVSLGTPTTNDNCGVATTTNNAPASFPVGSTTVTWTVTDVNGNTNTCTQTVNVTDNQNPTITCPGTVNVNVDAGSCVATGVALGTPTTNDNCGVASTTNNAPASFPVGATTVTWTVTDVNGNTNTCTQTVNVTDNINPTISCPGTVNVNADAGSCVATGVALGTPTTNDNCGVASTTNNAPASFPVGSTTVTWTVTDNNGNTATCTQTVNVTDNQNPTITCPGTVNVNTDAGLCTASGVALGTPTTNDNCGVASSTNNAPATFPVGATTVTWTVTDVNGNTATCTQTVNVTDNENPTISCPGTVNVNVDAGSCTASGVSLGTPTTGDNCAVASTTNNAPATFPVGATTVTWTVTDVNGNTNTCTQTVNVTDNQNPTITCPGTVNVNADAGSCVATGVSLGTPTTSDNCGVASVTNNAPASFPVGATTVTWTVTDNNGNTNTCTQTVNVTDNQNPTINCPGTVNVNTDAGICSASGVSLGTPTTADNCAVATTTNNAPAVFPIGATTVTWTVTDVNGNSTTCTQTVNVIDNENPTITCPGNQNENLDANCEFTLSDYTSMATAGDNCTVSPTVTQSPAVGTVITGTTTVTLTATDGNGNTSSCTFDVIPADNTPPTVICQNVTVTLDATGNGSTTAAAVDNGSTDNCGIASMSLSQTAFNCSDVGTVNVVLAVSDNNGNSATCNATVTVVDPNVPTVSAGPDDAICSADTYTLAGVLGGSATAGTWTTSGDGSFSLNTDPNAVYTPGVNDISNGSVILTFTTDPSPCATATSDMTLTIDPSPSFTVALGNHPTACGATDGTIVISGLNPNTSYDIDYNDGSGTVNLGTVTTDGSGNYTITGLGADGYSNFVVTLGPCSTTVNTPIGLSDPSAPTFTVGSPVDPTTCGGTDGSITISGLMASTSYDITYDNGSGTVNLGTVSTDASGNFIITGLGADSYTNFVITISGCTGSDNSTITLNDPAGPTFTVGSPVDPTACGATDGSITISGLSPNTSYDISYDDGSGTVNLGTVTTDGSGNYVITGLGADTYTNFSVTDGINCSTVDAGSISLTDPSAPTFTVGSPVDPTSCGGTDGSITISGLNPSTSYDISYDDGSGTVNLGTVTTDAAGNYVITGLGADTYTNFVVVLTGCTGTDASSITLSDPAAPTFTMGTSTDPTTCGGTDGTITITGLTPSTSYDISYDDGSGTVNLGTVTSDAAGNYVITGLGADTYTNFTVTLTGCSTTDNVTSITLNDPNAPTFTVGTPVDPSTCGGTDGSITISGLSPNTSYDISYDDGSGTVNLGTVVTDAAGDYIITGLGADTHTNFTVTLTGCTGTDNSSITLVDPNAPTFTISFTDPTSCGGTDGTITISGLSASTSYDITYDDGAGTVNLGTVTTDASGNYIITGLGAGAYTNFVVSLTGCTGTDNSTITLSDPNAPTFTISSTDPTTCGGTDGTITISGLSASTSYDITYDDATGTVNLGTVSSDAAGDYVITGLGAGAYSNFSVTFSGCNGVDNSTVTLTDPATPSAPTAGTDFTYCIGDPLADLTATAGSGGTLDWFSDAGLTNNIGNGPTLTPGNTTGTTVYYVTETAAGCQSAASSVTIIIEQCVVLELEIPTGFTPDGDGVNDVWDIVNLNALYPNCVVRVVNRWGNLLFESNGYATPWDGTRNGEELPTGSYFFTIDFGDDSMNPESGSITIIRN